MNENIVMYTPVTNSNEFKGMLAAKSFEGKDVSWRNLIALDLSGFNLMRADLSYSVLPQDPQLFQKILGRNLYRTRLPKINLGDYNLSNVNINYADLTACNFPDDPKFLLKFFMQQMHGVVFPRGINLEKYDVNDVSFTNAIFMESVIPEKFFMEATLMPTGITFVGCDFSKVVAKNIEFINCNFVDTNLFAGQFSDVLFTGCYFDRAAAEYGNNGVKEAFLQQGNEFIDSQWNTVDIFYRFIESYCR